MIRKIKWNSHPILGDLELRLTKNNKVCNTIILAGENGTGKTTILEALQIFINRGRLEQIQELEYDNENKSYTIKSSKLPGIICTIECEGKLNNIVKNDGTKDVRDFGCIYSKARSGFKTGIVISTSNQQLDISKHENDDNEDFTSIKQLIVDIDAQDSSRMSEICRTNGMVEWFDFEPTTKIYRFKNAFNNFFDNIKFNKVDNSSKEEKKILFTKNEKDIVVDTLSTGEKQIVFRGTYLLRNSNNIQDGIVLIDEPELSMHPKWQEKILKYYRGLFTNEEGQAAQLILATHSEYVIRSGLEDKENVLIIILNQKDGRIEAKSIDEPFVLPTITAAEINYLAFGIVSNDYHIALYGYIQELTEHHTVMDCDSFIKNHTLYNEEMHYKEYTFRNTTYETLPTYIRNAIDHPDDRTFTQEELKCSIELLIKICKALVEEPSEEL